MKLGSALGASILLVLAAPAAAQVYPGEEVTVNPGAIGHGYLLYPGGKYGRHVGNLLQPGDRPGAVIHLHMPGRHPATHVARHSHPPAAAPVDVASDLAPPPPAPHHTPRIRRTASATPPPAPPPVAATPPPDAGADAVPEDSAARLFATGPTAAPPPAPPRHVASAPPPAKPRHPAPPPPASTPAPTDDAAIPFTLGGPMAAPPPPRRTARAAPPPAATTAPTGVAAGLRRQSIIPFAPGASSPATADVNAIHSLATTLNAALAGGAAHVQLEAYGGPRGDKSSDSRRLSLKRALVVRELLIEDGVPSEKIDVRAMGGADDNGAADRVDVFVRA
ncbi:MAG TPA: hypothetical protein VNU97_12080 [Rhizomicrobium sp.]|nr:hypothetical protein [Rhizomicrobium sp.]